MLGILRHSVPVGPSEAVLPLSDTPQNGIVIGTAKGRVAHKQDVHDDACAPDVAAALVASLSQNLQPKSGCGIRELVAQGEQQTRHYWAKVDHVLTPVLQMASVLMPTSSQDWQRGGQLCSMGSS